MIEFTPEETLLIVKARQLQKYEKIEIKREENGTLSFRITLHEKYSLDSEPYHGKM